MSTLLCCAHCMTMTLTAALMRSQVDMPEQSMGLAAKEVSAVRVRTLTACPSTSHHCTLQLATPHTSHQRTLSAPHLQPPAHRGAALADEEDGAAAAAAVAEEEKEEADEDAMLAALLMHGGPSPRRAPACSPHAALLGRNGTTCVLPCVYTRTRRSLVLLFSPAPVRKVCPGPKPACPTQGRG